MTISHKTVRTIILLLSAVCSAQVALSQVNDVTVDAAHEKGRLDRFSNRCVGAGRAYTFLRSDHQHHIAMAAEECGFRYLRFHGLFQDDMGVYRENRYGEPFYSWQYVDAVYDFILDTGMRPIVVLDFMPSALASGDSTIYWEKANITPPADYGKWYGLVKATAEHFVDRYGLDEVKEWYFEVWNEPDGYFFTGDREEYLKLYDASAKAVKEVSAELKVGGPAIAGDRSWISALIEHCSGLDIPLDFISTHTYSTRGFYPDSVYASMPDPEYLERIPVWDPGTPWQMGNVAYDPEGIAGSIEASVETVRKSSMPDLEVCVTEWGLTWDYWDPLRDSYQAASYILDRIKSTGGISMLSYCEVSDVFEEDGPPTADFHGGFGLVNLQGIRKPAYFAYRYLNRLGDTELECTYPDAIAAKDSTGIQILIWDDSCRQDDINKIYYAADTPPGDAGQIRLLISGLRKGRYTVNLYGVGYRMNDAYTEYLGMAYNGSLSREQVEHLKSVSADRPLRTDRIRIGDSGDIYEYVIDIRENDVYLVDIDRQ